MNYIVTCKCKESPHGRLARSTDHLPLRRIGTCLVGLALNQQVLATGSWFVEVAPDKSDQDVRLFQNAAEAKTAKNRMHLDLHLGAEDREAEVERLIALGATKLWEGQQGPHKWDTLADPEGNEFCVA